MQVVYANEWPETICTKSIFLAGPTPREKDICSWRPSALEILRDKCFNGSVFYPETSNGEWEHGYRDQIDWEHYWLDRATIILMWVPRELPELPAFTTNIEFGLYIRSGRLRYGRPDNTPKTKYMDYSYMKYTQGLYPRDSLEQLITICLRDV